MTRPTRGPPLGWAYALGSIFETLGATFVSGFVIQNLGDICLLFFTPNVLILSFSRGHHKY